MSGWEAMQQGAPDPFFPEGRKAIEDRAPDAGSVERVDEGDGVPGQRPAPHSRDITPSGIEIEYFFKPRRYYEIREHIDPDDAFMPRTLGAAMDEQGRYLGPWREVPSVSTITDVFPSDALTYWGMRVGMEATLELYEQGALFAAKLTDGERVLAYDGRLLGGEPGLQRAGLKAVEAFAKKFRLRTNDRKDSAAERGQGVHDALEGWAKEWATTGELPDPSFFPPEQAGYVEGLRMFLVDLEKADPEVIATERMVGSVKHGFAGRFDLEIRTRKPAELAYRWTPKRGPKYRTVEPSLIVPDLKTSAFVYDKHFAQAEGYEIGRVECGYEPSDERAVIHVHPGDPEHDKHFDTPYYEFVPSPKPEKSAKAFLAALDFYNALEEL